MQKYLAFIIFIFCFNASMYSQSYHYDFENWNTNSIYDEPVSFYTLNFQSFFSTLEPNVKQVKGVKGNAIRLESVRSLFDTTVTVGLITNGDIFNFPSGGMAISSYPDSLTGYIKTKIVTGDTAILALVFKRVGIPVLIKAFPITNNVPNFTRFSVPIANSPIAPDTVLFLLSSGNIDRPVAGSFVEVDELQLVNSNTQIANANFEKWETITLEEPVDWATPNFISCLIRQPQPVTKTSDAKSGMYAMKIKTVKLNFDNQEIITGYAGPGEQLNGEFVSLAYGAKNAVFEFDYKYNPTINDTGWVAIQFSRYHQGQHQNIGFEIIPLNKNLNYAHFKKQFSLPFECDSAHFVFSSGNHIFLDKKINGLAGSELIIDDVRLYKDVSNSVDQNIPQNIIYPTISNDVVHVELYDNIDINNINWSIITIDGKEANCILMNIDDKKISFDIRSLHNGRFFLIGNSSTKTIKFIFEKN